MFVLTQVNAFRVGGHPRGNNDAREERDAEDEQIPG